MARWKLTDKEWDALDALRFSTTDVAVFRNATVILMSGVGRSNGETPLSVAIPCEPTAGGSVLKMSASDQRKSLPPQEDATDCDNLQSVATIGGHRFGG